MAYCILEMVYIPGGSTSTDPHCPERDLRHDIYGSCPEVMEARHLLRDYILILIPALNINPSVGAQISLNCGF